MKMSRTIAYAVHATLELADAGGQCPIPCSKLAVDGQMPERFLLQVLRNLVKHGILESTRGVDGGYRLNRPPDKITLLDIVEAFDNPLQPSLPEVPGIPSPVWDGLMSTLHSANSAARRELRKLTVADLRQATSDRPRI